MTHEAVEAKMENHNGQSFAKSPSVIKSPSVTDSPNEDIIRGEDVAENAVISEKVGTRKDQLDMMRMGKEPTAEGSSGSGRTMTSRLIVLVA